MTAASRIHPRAGQFRADGLWTRRTIGSYLEDAAIHSPTRLAVVAGRTRLTYLDLWGKAAGLAAGLSKWGLTAGATVSYILPNWVETVVLHHALTLLGAVSNPIVPIYRHTELKFILGQAEPSLLVLPHRYRDFNFVTMVEELRDEHALPERTRFAVARPKGPLPSEFATFESLFDAATESGRRHYDHAHPDDVTMLLYTSGTTGPAKGVLHTHETLIYENRSIASLFDLSSDDSIFMASPLSHITGVLYGLQLPLILGSKVVLQDKWDAAEAAQTIEREGCSFTVAATPFLQGLLGAYENLGQDSALRAFACGGADVPPDLIRRSRAQFGAAVVRVYGSTEFPTLSCSGPQESADVAATTDGRPIAAALCRVVDEMGRPLGANEVGELVVDGPECFQGYLDAHENAGSFTDDGFFRTGDLASINDQGFVTIHGRKKDIIIRLGEKISAKEVEDLLFGHPAVADVAVVAVPDGALGEIGCAFVVVYADQSFDFAEMTRYLATCRVAKQKFPERLEIVGGLPRTASGKVEKYRLREAAGAKHAIPGGART